MFRNGCNEIEGGESEVMCEFLNVTNEMQLLENFIINIAVHVSGTLRPSSGTYGNCTCSYNCNALYLDDRCTD